MSDVVIIVDDIYGPNVRPPRLYVTYCPTIRAKLFSFKVIEMTYDQNRTTNSNRQ